MVLLRTLLIIFCLIIISHSSYAQIDQTSDKRGLTFQSTGQDAYTSSGIFSAECDDESNAIAKCNPKNGDTLCSYEKPLLCFLDIDAPVPETLKNSQYWTGGILALSDPVSADAFSQLSDANAYCEATFGKGWRVASYHDGGGGGLKGYGATPKKDLRFWVDIKNKEDGTCWAR